METLDALNAARARHPTPPAAGSALEQQAQAGFADFFSSFAADRIERLLPATYAEDIYFNDTLKAVSGRAALAHYLEESAAAVDDCRVQIEDWARSEAGEHYVRWRMMIRFKKLRPGQDTWTVGCSHLRFNAEGRVVYHQDYWNAADGLYEHVPLLGSMIRWIKRRL